MKWMMTTKVAQHPFREAVEMLLEIHETQTPIPGQIGRHVVVHDHAS